MSGFFDQLAEFSYRYFDAIGIVERETLWGPTSYTEDKPVGAILHYTADDDLERVCKWFMREKYQAKAAANVIVCDRKLPSAKSLEDGLPLIQELPVTVVQCRPPEKPTWHATWASYQTYGIEAINVGELRYDPDTDQFMSHWRRNHDPSEPEWTMPWNHPLKSPVEGWYRLWEPYTVDQILAIIMVLRNLRQKYPKLMPEWVVGHECVQGTETQGAHTDKRDPGPLMPIVDIRECVFGSQSISKSENWIKAYEAKKSYCDEQRDEMIQEWAANEAGSIEVPSTATALLRFQAALNALLVDPATPFPSVGKLGLKLLGYHIPVVDHEMYDSDKKSVRIFQRMAGVKVDGIPGPVTRGALSDRLYDRGILSDGE
jgi:N-acetyl-anhydromuramyl-L-alanine amidase AmpD